jgi:hypothetical protein
LIARAKEIAPKRRGWVATPTINSDGHRTNASTVAVTAINLDCDGQGSWDVLRKALLDLKIAHVLYQSGGWTPSSPKWHLLIPLASPFLTPSPEAILEWRRLYCRLRVLFGALAQLPREGFDSTVDTPCIPVFVTERRSSSDPIRQVIFEPGLALDLDRLQAALPSEPPELPREAHERRIVEVDPLDDDRLEEVVETLCRPMEEIMEGRRELYLALAAALLDLGLEDDDVREVIEEISNRCPGDPRYTAMEIASKHREHLHAVETTIAAHARGQEVISTGTIGMRWPEVVRALDLAFPEQAIERAAQMRAETDEFLRQFETRRGPVKAVVPAPVPQPDPAPIPRSVSLHTVRAGLKALRRRLAKSKTFSDKIEAVVAEAIIDGDDLVPRMPDDTPLQTEEGVWTADRSVVVAARLLARVCPPEADFSAIKEILRVAVAATGDTAALFKTAESAFSKARRHRAQRRVERDERLEAALRRRLNQVVV